MIHDFLPINQPKQPSRLLRLRTSLISGVLLAALFLGGCGAATNSPVTSTQSSATQDQSQATTPLAVTETSTTQVQASGYQRIAPDTAKQMLAEDANVLLLDVRTAEEYTTGHIAGSQLLPYDEIPSRVSELPADKNRPIIVYCRSGRRSKLAADTLLGLGYTSIYDLGGIADWPYDTVQ